MWEKIKKIVVENVIWAEKNLKGKTGAEKKEAVIEKLLKLTDLSMVPNIIEDPIKRALFSWVIDMACEKLNWLTDWAFEGTELSDEHVEKVAATLEAPVVVMAKAVASNQSITERLNSLCEAYGLKSETTAPTQTDAKEQQVEEQKTGDPAPEVKDEFPCCAGVVLGLEGGEVNNPDDRGGHTNLGITEATLAGAVASGIVTCTDVSKLTVEEAEKIYRALYWDKYGWGDIRWPLCLILFDTTVNHGAGGMAKIVQRTLNRLGEQVTVDGKYGPETHAAIVKLAAVRSVAMSETLLSVRKQYYDDIIRTNPTQEKFRSGWYNRLKTLAEKVGVASPV
jgi:lysozyme family protein